jgi:hypothetical protein
MEILRKALYGLLYYLLKAINSVDKVDGHERRMLEEDDDETQCISIFFGDLYISCPFCGEDVPGVSLGIHTVEDTENEPEDDLPNLTQLGVIGYPCGDIVYSPCLTEKIAAIMNAHETDTVRLSMFHNLVACEEHGVDYPNQS